MRAQESIKFSNITSTSAPVGSNTPTNTFFPVQGGAYQFEYVASAWGTLTLNSVGPDGSTLLPVNAAPIVANGISYIYLAPGYYQATCSGATGLYIALTRIPND